MAEPGSPPGWAMQHSPRLCHPGCPAALATGPAHTGGQAEAERIQAWEERCWHPFCQRPHHVPQQEQVLPWLDTPKSWPASVLPPADILPTWAWQWHFSSLSAPHWLVPRQPAEPAPSSPPSNPHLYNASRGLKGPSRLLCTFLWESASLGAAPAAGSLVAKCPTTKKSCPPTFRAAVHACAPSGVLCPTWGPGSGREHAVCCVEQVLQVNSENSS